MRDKESQPIIPSIRPSHLIVTQTQKLQKLKIQELVNQREYSVFWLTMMKWLVFFCFVLTLAL